MKQPRTTAHNQIGTLVFRKSEAARLLTLSLGTISSEIRKGHLRSIRLSEKRIGITRAEIDRFLRVGMKREAAQKS